MTKKLLILFLSLVPIISSAGTLTVNNGGGATNITSTSAWLHVSVTVTGVANPSVFIFWGTNNGGTNVSAWMNTNVLGVKTVGTYNVQATGLTSDKLHYYRAYATNTSETNWATISALFRTLTAPTTAPPSSVEVVTVDTNDVLKHPGTNFWVANKTAILAGTGGLTNEPAFTNWLETNTYVHSNSGNWAGTWQELETNVFISTNDAKYLAALTNHNDAPDLQGGGAGEYYHLTLAEHGIATNDLSDEVAALQTGKVDTNHTGNVSIDGELNVYLSRRGSTNEEYELTEFVAYNKTLEEIAKSSALSLYANTNAHPVIAGATILSKEIPDSWCVTNIYTNAGTYLVATRLATNYVNQLRFGRYIGDIAAWKSGSGNFSLYLELIMTDGATTNTLSTSIPGSLLTTIQSISRLLCSLETNQPVAAGFYFGYNLWAIKTGVPTTSLILCGGAGSLTSLSTPGLASVDGFVEVDPVASSNLNAHVADTNNPHAVYPAQIGAVPTNDAAYLSILQSMTNYVHVPSSTNWQSYDPAARTLSGCTTNYIGPGNDIVASNITAIKFVSTNSAEGYTDSGFPKLSLYAYPLWDGGLSQRSGAFTDTDYPKLGVLSITSSRLIYTNTAFVFSMRDPPDLTGELTNCVVIKQAYNYPVPRLGIGRYPEYPLDVRGDGAFSGSVMASNVVTTNLQVMGGSPTTGAVIVAVDNAGNAAWKNKVFVMADINTQWGTNVSQIVTNYTEILDATSSFAPITGVFTAPRDINVIATFHGNFYLRKGDEYIFIYTNNVYVPGCLISGTPVGIGDESAQSLVVPLVLTNGTLLNFIFSSTTGSRLYRGRISIFEP